MPQEKDNDNDAFIDDAEFLVKRQPVQELMPGFCLNNDAFIDNAEFIVNGKPEQEIMPGFCLNNYAFIDEPLKIPRKLYLADDCQQEFFIENIESVNFEYIYYTQIRSCELIEPNTVIEGMINTENIPPPPYDTEIIDENNELPDYSVPYIDPPQYEPNPDIDYKRIILQNFITKYYLPNYSYVYTANGASRADRSELFWGPEGRGEYDAYQDGMPNTWWHSYRINQATEYYDPENDWGEQDSVLRLNNNLYSEWLNNTIYSKWCIII